jgi:hypothetical protein
LIWVKCHPTRPANPTIHVAKPGNRSKKQITWSGDKVCKAATSAVRARPNLSFCLMIKMQVTRLD